MERRDRRAVVAGRAGERVIPREAGQPDWALAGAARWIGDHTDVLLCLNAAGDPAWRRHGIAPLLWQTIRTRGPTLVSGDVAVAVEARCRAIAQANLWRMGALQEILAACAAADIRVLTFKGPTLGVLAFGDLARREFVDLDLLVPAPDVVAAWECLEGLGYIASPPLTAAQRSVHARTGHQQAFVHGASRLAVELHWALPAARPRDTHG